ncbi:MAG: hypothetical protein KGH63_04360, partial [Candidatus Micrarchaeota archaeon]|nr:hypothetical protein [Candidatus Micrarchaeota archaeon]
MANASLQQMVPTREFGDPLDAPAAPGLRRFSIEPLPNPLLALGLADMVWARGFLHKIEMDLQELHRQRMSQPQTMLAGGLAYAPMSRVEADLRELQRREKAAREQTAMAASQAKPTPAAGGALLDDAAAKLSEELWAASAGNLELATSVLDRFWAKFSQEKFQTPDLMSLLLISHEEVLWENESLSPTAGGAAPGAGMMRMGAPSLHLQVAEGEQAGGMQTPFASPLQVVATAPQAPGAAVIMPLQPRHAGEKTDVEIAMASGRAARATASRQEVEVRLISIREMLWHYFQAYP